MARVYNFSAGPSMLPEAVLETARQEMLDYRGTGMSVMEMSHRSAAFSGIIEEAETLLRDIMGIPEHYKVLFLQGGASTQFAMVPLNLFHANKKADFIITGSWSKKAAAEAKRYGDVHIVATSEDSNFSYIPSLADLSLSSDADYLHITTNNTIYGTAFHGIPETGAIPLVADMSSNILSERCDVSRFGIIYAGAQKNIGPAGLTIVIIREDLVGKALDITPTMLNYETHTTKRSLFNTPPCYSIYVAGLTFSWIKAQGGIAVMERKNREKARMLYDMLDNSRLFKTTAERDSRSIMNVTFTLPSEELTAKCLTEAQSEGLVTLKGHRSVGGLRASMYNAMPRDGIQKLVQFLKRFESENG
jgi:phosphoserine aminotransferase